ncbi:hypothetical protein KCU65_g3673, partial [Aureobasidium melanogenum]
MSHGGPATMAQKKLMAMRSGNANAPQQVPGPHHMPLLPAVYDQSSSASTSPRPTGNQPLAAFGDIEMQDISAPASPPANYSHSRPPPSFSAAAKPFVPPGVADHSTETMPLPSTTPMKRLPPHRAMQAQPPKNSAAIPIVKPEPPVAPALTEKSAVEPPARRTGPHAKLGPHARKVDTPVQADASSTVPVPADKINLQQTPDPGTLAGVQEPQVETKVAQSESSSVHQETEVKAEPEAAPGADKPATLDSAPSAEPQAPAVQQVVAPSNQVNPGTRHIGPNKWLAILNDMNDPEKGCEIILALADHLRVSVESRKFTAGELETAKEMSVLMENAAGQRMPGKLDADMTVSDMIKQCASYINVKESDIQIVLKINESEEL